MIGWKRVALGDIAEIETAGVEPRDIEDGALYVGLEHIDSAGRISPYRVQRGELKSQKYAFSDEHILYGKLRPNLRKVACPIFSGVCSTDILPILPGPQIDRRYLFHYFRIPEVVEWATVRAVGANLPRLNPAILRELKIPLPPLPEQRRIADILDKADELRAKRRAAIEMLDSLVESIFLEMFGDPVANPRRFPKRPLRDLIRVKSGQSLVLSDLSPSGPYPVYGGNGVNGYHKEYTFEDPRIVIGRVGVNCGAVYITMPKSWVTDNALYVAEMSSDLMTEYLAEALRLANLNQYASRAAQPLISGSRIYPVEILVPPLGEQSEFSRRIKRVETVAREYQSSLHHLDQLFSSLQQRAFRGELSSESLRVS